MAIEEESNNTLNSENTTDQLTQSRRIPRVSVKYLESIKAELQDLELKKVLCFHLRNQVTISNFYFQDMVQLSNQPYK